MFDVQQEIICFETIRTSPCARYVISHPRTYCYQVQNNGGAANGTDSASIDDGDDEVDDGMRGVVFFGGGGGGSAEPPQLTIREENFELLFGSVRLPSDSEFSI